MKISLLLILNCAALALSAWVPGQRFIAGSNVFYLGITEMKTQFLAMDYCRSAGLDMYIADILDVQKLNEIRANFDSLGLPQGIELWLAGRSPLPPHSPLTDNELNVDHGDQCRILSSWPGNAQVWNLYAKNCEDQERYFLCEDNSANAALNRVAIQSSTAFGHYATQATNGEFYNSYSATNQQQNAWWIVDIGQIVAVKRTVIKHKLANSDPLTCKVQVFSYNQTPIYGKSGVTCATYSPTDELEQWISCDKSGRYVAIVADGSQVLQLYQVMVQLLY